CISARSFASRSAIWPPKPESRHFPSLTEYLAAVWLVPRKNQTPIQQLMLGTARRVHAVRCGSVLAALFVIGLSIVRIAGLEREKRLRSYVSSGVYAMESCRGVLVPERLKDLKRLPERMVVETLRSRYAVAEPQGRMKLAYALAKYGDVKVRDICSRIENADSEEIDNIAEALREAGPDSIEELERLAEQATKETNWIHKTRLAVIALHLDHDRIARDMCQIQDRTDPIQRTMFIETFSDWHGDLSVLARHVKAGSDGSLQSGLCLGIASIPELQQSSDVLSVWKPLLEDLYQHAQQSVVHSSAGLALRRWKVPLPPLADDDTNIPGRDWVVNAVGMTMLKILPGKFVKREHGFLNPNQQSVELTRPFFLSDCEISVSQFQAFMDDAAYPPEQKPAGWAGVDRMVSPADDCPVQQVSWSDAVLFCNWLSRKEGLEPCYLRTNENEAGNNPKEGPENDDCRLLLTGTGYWLPTQAEWEYACRAGTTTDFSSGDNKISVRKYAVIQEEKAAASRSMLPNAWGLFDMHGNVCEWCHNWSEIFSDQPVIDPVGPERGLGRVYQGGMFNGRPQIARPVHREQLQPSVRNRNIGFRCARFISSGQPGA
ncbi:MAG: formylglycine-generating enzyme family protein, partial [Schlesneria sp.]